MIGYDAGFLLRGVSASAWSSLVKVSDRWRDLCRLTCREGVIMPSYSSKGSLKQLLGEEFGQIDNEKEVQLRDWALDALEVRFGADHRVLRQSRRNCSMAVSWGRVPDGDRRSNQGGDYQRVSVLPESLP